MLVLSQLNLLDGLTFGGGRAGVTFVECPQTLKGDVAALQDALVNVSVAFRSGGVTGVRPAVLLCLTAVACFTGGAATDAETASKCV